MRSLLVALLGALAVTAAGGCRLLCDDCRSRSYRLDDGPVVATPPAVVR